MITVDYLIEETLKKKNPSVIGLDPDISRIPDCFKQNIFDQNPLQATATVIEQWNRNIIDSIYDLGPAVKPQIAFYEKYGSYGIHALENTIQYAKEKGLLVIEDAKRNDIGNTAWAYAQAHLGKVETITEENYSSVSVDFLTVSPFLGSEGLIPFIQICKSNGKGIFILVKTSNLGAQEIQSALTAKGLTVSEYLASYIAGQADTSLGKYGYSAIGAVVGATYPNENSALRKIMPKSYFLVPGYGAQGGTEQDVMTCFNSDGLGALINSSREILFSHTTDIEQKNISKTDYCNRVREATKNMQKKIYHALKITYPNMIY